MSFSPEKLLVFAWCMVLYTNECDILFSPPLSRMRIKDQVVKKIMSVLPKIQAAPDDASRQTITSNAYDKVKNDLHKDGPSPRAPRGSVAAMVRRLERHHDMAQNFLRENSVVAKLKTTGYNTGAAYGHVVQSEFEGIWQVELDVALAVPKVETSAPKSGPISEQETKAKPQYRTCELPLSRILRKEFDKTNADHIVDLFECSQRDLSAHMEQIQSAVLKAHVEVRNISCWDTCCILFT